MAQEPEFIENFTTFQLPFPVVELLQQAFRSVPSKYTSGIQKIVLRDKAGLSRSERRGAVWSRGRKVKTAAVLGRYHPKFQNALPWIELRVDVIWESLSPFERTFRAFRDLAFYRVLFHEIGHHIHFTKRPEHREKEDVAERWENHLGVAFFKRRHRWLWLALLPFLFAVRGWKKLPKLWKSLKREIARSNR